MSGSGRGCPFRKACSQKEQPLRLPTAAGSPYILRTVTFLWNVPVFRPAYSALPKRSDFSRFAAYEGGAEGTAKCSLPCVSHRAAYSQKEQPLRLPTAASSPYILRTVTFLWNVPVFRPAYSALPKRSDFSRFAAYEGGAIETMCFLPPLCTLRTSAPKGGMVPLYASPVYPKGERSEPEARAF